MQGPEVLRIQDNVGIVLRGLLCDRDPSIPRTQSVPNILELLGIHENEGLDAKVESELRFKE